MANDIIKMMVPAVGESINEVTISSWLKKEGDVVELDEIIAWHYFKLCRVREYVF